MDFRAPVKGRLTGKAPWLALALILVAASLRFYRLTSQPLWYDELAAIALATVPGGLEGIWSVRFYPHPPLFAALLRAVFQVFAPSEFSARLIPLFGGLAAFPLLYRYASDVASPPVPGRHRTSWLGPGASKQTALLAMFLLALSPFHIFFCQDTRSYALTLTLVVLTLWVLHQALVSNRAGWWVAHAGCILLLLYLHFFNWSIVGSEVLYMLVYWRRYRRSLVPFALSLLVCALALPSLYNLLRDSQAAGRLLVLDFVPVSISFSSTWMTLVAGEERYATQAMRLAAVVAFGLLACAGCLNWARHRPRLLVLALCLLVVPFSFVFVFLPAMGRVVPAYEERQFIVVLPFALMLTAAGAEHLCLAWRPRRAGNLGAAVAACLLAVLLGSNLLALYRYYTVFEKNLDMHVIDYLGSHVEPGDAIICQGTSIAMNMDFHWDVDLPVALFAHPLRRGGAWMLSERLSIIPVDALQWDVSLDDVLSHPRVWLVTQDGYDSPAFAADMQGLATQVSVEHLGPFSVYLFVP